MISNTPKEILRFLLACAGENLDTVLVTLTGIDGSASRAAGTQMVVAEDGRYIGSLSSGCVEGAVVTEALGTLATGQVTEVRYGKGSPYVDIRLPCGGGIDIMFNPRPDVQSIHDAMSLLKKRVPTGLRVSRDGVDLIIPTGGSPFKKSANNGYEITYAPPLRLVVIGQGEEVTSLARLSCHFGVDVKVWTPDSRVLPELATYEIDATELVSQNVLPHLHTDQWTAIVLLFHDPYWEEQLLGEALKFPFFYIGAVGSRHTHDARLNRLKIARVPEHLWAALRGPIGLIPATRDPSTLALSIFSEVVRDYNLLVQ